MIEALAKLNPNVNENEFKSSITMCQMSAMIKNWRWQRDDEVVRWQKKLMDAFDFNGDQHTDYILLLKHQQEKSFENEGTGFSKVLLIVASYPSGKLAQIERNHRVVFPFGYHQKDKDSYLSMHQQGRFFQVVHSWTKNKRIKRTLSFEYNQTNRSWYLHKDQTTYNSIDFSENPTIVQKTTAGTAFHSFDIFQE